MDTATGLSRHFWQVAPDRSYHVGVFCLQTQSRYTSPSYPRKETHWSHPSAVWSVPLPSENGTECGVPGTDQTARLGCRITLSACFRSLDVPTLRQTRLNPGLLACREPRESLPKPTTGSIPSSPTRMQQNNKWQINIFCIATNEFDQFCPYMSEFNCAEICETSCIKSQLVRQLRYTEARNVFKHLPKLCDTSHWQISNLPHRTRARRPPFSLPTRRSPDELVNRRAPRCSSLSCHWWLLCQS